MQKDRRERHNEETGRMCMARIGNLSCFPCETVTKTWAENIWRESVRTVIRLLPLRNGSGLIASVLSAMKIHDEYRLNGTKMTSK